MHIKTWILTGIALVAIMISGLLVWTFYQAKADTQSGCKTAAFYSEPNYGAGLGSSYGCLPLGGFYTPALEPYNLVGKISSVDIASGYKVMLFKENNFDGASITLTSSTPNLATKGFDNATLSIRVLNINDPEFGAEDEELNCDTVGVYSESNYGDMGAAACMSVGEYSHMDTDFDNSLSSVKVSSGYKAILYKDQNFGGDSLELTASISSLATKNFANVTSSMKVEKIATSCSAPLSETRTQACPEGQTGSITQTRSKSAAPSCSWGDWAQTASTCVANTPAPTTAEPATPATSNVTTPSGTAASTVTPATTDTSSTPSEVPSTESSTSNRWVVWLIVGIGLIGLTIGVYFWIRRRPV